jgi:hypothetical protein
MENGNGGSAEKSFSHFKTPGDLKLTLTAL